MQTYSKLNESLTGRCSQRRKLANNTYAERRDNDSIAIRLHQTDILTFNPDGSIVCNSGGWKTHTTKDRLNSYLPVRIWQHRGRWFLGDNGSTVEFQDGLTIQTDGKITGGKPESEANKEKALQSRIKAYCKGLQAALPLPMPGNGDCFYCAMREVKTKLPLGEVSKSTDHLESHFEEKYYVPALVWRALEFAGCQPQGSGCAWFWYAFGKDTIQDHARKQIARFVQKYLRRQFGLA